jgi:hypothetical protein
MTVAAKLLFEKINIQGREQRQNIHAGEHLK